MDVVISGASGLIGTRAERASCGGPVIACCGLRRGGDHRRRRHRVGSRRRAASTRRRSKASTRSCTSRARGSATSAGPTSRSDRILESRVRARACSPARSRVASASRACSCPARRSGTTATAATKSLTEDSTPGDDFLAGVVQRWEAETQPASRRRHPHRAHPQRHRARRARRCAEAAAAAVQARRSVVASVRASSGCRGSRSTTKSARSCTRSSTESLRGPVNLVAPTPVVNAEFTSTLGERAAPADGVADAAAPVEARVRRRARRVAAARESARDADAPRGERLHVPAPDARSRPARGAATLTCAAGSTPTSVTTPTTRSRCCARPRIPTSSWSASARSTATSRSAPTKHGGSCRTCDGRRGLAAARRGAAAPTPCCSSGRGPTAPSSSARAISRSGSRRWAAPLRPVIHRGELRVIEHNVSRDPATRDALASAARARAGEPRAVVPLDVSATIDLHARRGARDRARRSRASPT